MLFLENLPMYSPRTSSIKDGWQELLRCNAMASLENLQSLLNIVVTESERKGLSLNVKKTECMVVSKNAVNPICNLESKGEKINQVQKFKYLGYIITSDGKCVTEIKRRIGMAKDSFNKMKPILKNRKKKKS